MMLPDFSVLGPSQSHLVFCLTPHFFKQRIPIYQTFASHSPVVALGTVARNVGTNHQSCRYLRIRSIKKRMETSPRDRAQELELLLAGIADGIVFGTAPMHHLIGTNVKWNADFAEGYGEISMLSVYAVLQRSSPIN